MKTNNKPKKLSLCTFNIVAGSNARLEAALRMMRLMNMDIGVLTETKLVDGYHTRKTEGYDIITTEAKNHHQGGVALFYRESDEWHVKGTRSYGPNVIRTELVSGRKRWILIGAYIPPSETDGKTIDYIQAATNHNTRQHPIVLLGDLNVAVKNTWNRELNERQADTLAMIASLGLTDLGNHFKQRTNWKDWTWTNRNANGQRIRSVCDYILVEKRSDFTSFQIKQPRFDSDHRLVKRKGDTKSPAGRRTPKILQEKREIPDQNTPSRTK